MAAELPTGTVTFLFTDIEGSSRLWEEQPSLMPAALARHDELLREAIGRCRGMIFSTGGDGLAASFGRAVDAVEAAMAAQTTLAFETWPDPIQLRVRMALHTGEADERGGDYFGSAVNRAARLTALAEGGQVLVSAATAEVVAGLLPSDVCLVDVGQRQLRSLARSEHVFQLTWPGSAAPPAPLITGSAVGNLPRVRAELVGRAAEVAEISDLVSRSPLVTLTGVGGVGKTSLALAVAHQLAEGLTDGVWLCELAAVLDEDRVVTAVAERMGLRPQVGLTQQELLVRALSRQECLLLLDNCEHVLDAAGALAQAVVERCPTVGVLATSREGLGVPGERIVAVRSLTPGAAAELFGVRVAEHQGGFDMSADDRHVVDELCQRLDGLPLAIELAAARARSMSLRDLTSRLGDRFRLLRGQRRATERHQTLRATVAWSYDLLTADERMLFDRLSVFAGGFSLEAAEAVCADDELDAIDVDDLVAALVDKSMIVTGPPGRYVLLETLRQFGEEQLAARGSPDRFRRTHARYFAELSVAVHAGLQGPDELSWWRRLQDDWANIRAAFAYACDNGDVGTASTIATHLVWAATWHDTSEPLLWVDAVASLPGVETHENWPSVLGGRAWAAWDRGDLEQARSLGLQSLAVEGRSLSTIDRLAEFALLSAAYFSGDSEMARTYLQQGIERACLQGSPVVEATYGASFAIFAHGDQRYEEAVEICRKGRRLAERTGNPNAIAWLLTNEARSLVELDDPAALATTQQALTIASEVEAVLAVMLARRTLVILLLRRDRRGEAAELVLRTLQALRRKAAGMWIQQTLIVAADVLTVATTAPAAARLYGATHSSSAAGAPSLGRQLADICSRLIGILGRHRFDEFVAAGEDMTMEQATRLAEEALAELIPKGS